MARSGWMTGCASCQPPTSNPAGAVCAARRAVLGRSSASEQSSWSRGGPISDSMASNAILPRSSSESSRLVRGQTRWLSAAIRESTLRCSEIRSSCADWHERSGDDLWPQLPDTSRAQTRSVHERHDRPCRVCENQLHVLIDHAGKFNGRDVRCQYHWSVVRNACSHALGQQEGTGVRDAGARPANVQIVQDEQIHAGQPGGQHGSASAPQLLANRCCPPEECRTRSIGEYELPHRSGRHSCLTPSSTPQYQPGRRDARRVHPGTNGRDRGIADRKGVERPAPREVIRHLVQQQHRRRQARAPSGLVRKRCNHLHEQPGSALGRVRPSACACRVEVRSQTGDVLLEVSDHGIAIPD